MKIITIAFIEPSDIKEEYHSGVPMRKITKKHLTCKIPDGVDAVFTGGGRDDVKEIVDNLSKDLSDTSYYRMTKLKK